jgi:hypothetical protein
VGNLRELELAGGETKRLVEHIRLHGEIRSELGLNIWGQQPFF